MSPAQTPQTAEGRGAPLPFVSVVIPARNEERTLPAALDSVLAQDYAGEIEIIVADGSDTPALDEIVRERYPSVRLAPNPQRTTPAGLNLALREARGEVIVRVDAHAALPQGYVRRAVETLARTGAANVGGRMIPVGETFFQRAVAAATSTPMGTGRARYRDGGAEGPADTVYLGAFRRDALEAAGGFDETLLRSQDSDLNWRLRRRGEVVWFDPELAVAYRPRRSFGALARQYFDYGRWKSAILLRHPSALRPRQLAPPLLALALAASALLALAGATRLAAVVPLAYLFALVTASAWAGLRRREPAAALAPLALVVMHLSWGIGFFLPARRKRRQFV